MPCLRKPPSPKPTAAYLFCMTVPVVFNELIEKKKSSDESEIGVAPVVLELPAAGKCPSLQNASPKKEPPKKKTMMSSEASAQTQLPIAINDLGTTYSAVAYLDASGRPTTVLNGAGELLTPRAVSFEDAQVIVGKEAIKSSVFEPAVFADCFKRDMGRTAFRRSIGAVEVPPEVLSAFILERLKLDAHAGAIRQGRNHGACIL